jgi:hypothetical protein
MFPSGFLTLLVCASVGVPAQRVASAGPSVMKFSDGMSGVTFEYPASWTFSNEQSFYLPPAIVSQASPVRGSVFTKEMHGIPSWPYTNFVGAEFVFTSEQVNSDDACRALANADNQNGSKPKPETLHGLTFSHGTSANAGLGHGINEDIYTINKGNTCWLFDLAVHSSGVPGDRTPRALTSGEKEVIAKQLQSILASVRIKAFEQ